MKKIVKPVAFELRRVELLMKKAMAILLTLTVWITLLLSTGAYAVSFDIQAIPPKSIMKNQVSTNAYMAPVNPLFIMIFTVRMLPHKFCRWESIPKSPHLPKLRGTKPFPVFL